MAFGKPENSTNSSRKFGIKRRFRNFSPLLVDTSDRMCYDDSVGAFPRGTPFFRSLRTTYGHAYRSVTSRFDTRNVGNGYGRSAERTAVMYRVGRNEKRRSPTETPQHYHPITSEVQCQLSGGEKGWILPFIPFKRKLFVGFPVLKTGLPCGRLMVRKKVIPDMVSTPAGWAFKIFRFT